MRGRRVALSLPRRLLTNLSHLARGVPRATLMTRINFAALMAPRDQARIPWPVVFAKAYALVAAGSPPLRRSTALPISAVLLRSPCCRCRCACC
jgi:hypothetical protein